MRGETTVKLTPTQRQILQILKINKDQLEGGLEVKTIYILVIFIRENGFYEIIYIKFELTEIDIIEHNFSFEKDWRLWRNWDQIFKK